MTLQTHLFLLQLNFYGDSYFIFLTLANIRRYLWTGRLLSSDPESQKKTPHCFCKRCSKYRNARLDDFLKLRKPFSAQQNKPFWHLTYTCHLESSTSLARNLVLVTASHPGQLPHSHHHMFPVWKPGNHSIWLLQPGKNKTTSKAPPQTVEIQLWMKGKSLHSEDHFRNADLQHTKTMRLFLLVFTLTHRKHWNINLSRLTVPPYIELPLLAES